MYDVVALGELLIDLTSWGKSPDGNGLFEANPGGAPCNVLAMLAKWGKRTGFIGKVGEDGFGDLLHRTIEEAGIDAAGLCRTGEAPTTLAVVQTDGKGERQFSFYRNPGADRLLSPADLPEGMLENTRIFHFGSLSLTHPTVREATRQAIRRAGEAGALLSFDPNLRPLLWEDLALAREQMLYGCSVCQILKVEQEELRFLTGEEEIQAGVDWLRERFAISLILVTLGAEGSRAYTASAQAFQPAFLMEKTVDTTGAGDTFLGCCLAYILENGLPGLKKFHLEEMLKRANAAAGLVTTKKGAIRSMPEISRIQALLAERA